MTSLKSRILDKLNQLKAYVSPEEQAELNGLLDELQRAELFDLAELEPDRE